jgi:uncharacterized protein YjbJ (UPF0337 family)
MGERADRLNDLFPGQGAGVRAIESDDPEVIAAQIERTRAGMTNTIDALQDRLAPELLANQAKETATEVTDHARDAAKETIHYAIDEAKTAIRELSDDGTFARLSGNAVEAAGRVTDHAKEAAKEAATHAIDEGKAAVRELSGQATGAMRAATLGRVEHLTGMTRERMQSQETGTEMLALIRENPLPATIAAVGLGWLWMQRSGQGQSTSAYGSYSGNGQHQGGIGNLGHQVVGQAQHVVGQVGHSVGDMVSQAQDMTGQVGGQARSAGGSVQTATKSLTQGISGDPLALAALGVALGAAAAILLPATEQERQLMGQAHDRMMEQAQAVGAETVEKVQRVATEVGKAAVEQAAAQGLGKPADATASPT